MPAQVPRRFPFRCPAIAFLVAWVCAQFSSAFGGDPDQTGIEDYMNGDYERAVEEWEKTIGPEVALSPQTFYYLGNSYYRLEQYGSAALNYRRALLLDPGFVEARQNLTVVEAATGALVAERDFIDHLFRPGRANLLLISASASVWIALFLIAAALLWKTRVGLLWSIALSLLCYAAAAGVGFSISQNRGSYEERITLTGKGHSILSAPASGATTLIRLPQGSEATVLQERGPWIYIETPEDEPVRGWIRSEWCQRLWPPDAVKKNPAAIADDGTKVSDQEPATSVP